jgi:hypothetical protein
MASVRPAPANHQPIESNSRGTVRLYWFIAVVWNVVSGALVHQLPMMWANQKSIAILAALFPLVGIWLLYHAAVKTLQWRRFGSLKLMLQPSPGVVGHEIAGVVELPERFPSTTDFRITLDCIHRRVSNRGRDRTTWEKTIWQDQVSAQPVSSGRGTRLSFRFRTAPGLPGSEPESDDYRYWRVRLHAELPGADLDHSFTIPMVPGSANTLASTLPADVRRASVPTISSRIVRISRQGGAIVLHYPPLRSPGTSLALIVFGAIFLASAGFIYSASGGGIARTFASLMIGAFGLIGLLLLLLGWYTLLNSLTVELSARGITTTRRWLGFAHTRSMLREQASRLESKITSQSRKGDEFRVRYSLYLWPTEGRKLTVGDDIPGRDLVEHLADVIRQALNLK